MEKFLKQLIVDAGKILKSGYGKKIQITNKTISEELVTKYDIKSEQFIIKTILKRYPNHGIMGEESGHLIKKNDF